MDNNERIPDDLLKKLKSADDRLHVARHQLERTMDGSEFRHQERIDEKMDEFRKVEQEVEAVADEISENMAAPPEAVIRSPKQQ